MTIPYTAMTASKPYAVKDLKNTILSMEWAEYEVAPEWRKFCSFGPEDIGTVWEKIGAIRKRPRISMAIVSEAMMKKLDNEFSRYVLGEPSSLFGFPVQVSPYLSGMSGFLINERAVLPFPQT